MFPLQKRQLIRGCKEHIAAGLGCAADYVAVYIPFYIPFDGVVSHITGPQGGLQLKLTRPNGDQIELFHLKSISCADGSAKAGQLGGITGNSGLLKPGAPPYKPHLHVQIFNKAGIRLNPETYNWEKGSMQIKTQAKGPSRRIILEAADENEWAVLTKVYGKDPNTPEENVKDN